jgi:hypothetical protein
MIDMGRPSWIGVTVAWLIIGGILLWLEGAHSMVDQYLEAGKILLLAIIAEGIWRQC